MCFKCFLVHLASLPVIYFLSFADVRLADMSLEGGVLERGCRPMAEVKAKVITPL